MDMEDDFMNVFTGTFLFSWDFMRKKNVPFISKVVQLLLSSGEFGKLGNKI